ncbi:MAG: Y-family DNA polymerase [Rickettsiales bacterium]
MHPRFLFLDLNSYFASVEQQLKPDLRGEPVIVVPVMTDATSAIAASYEAKAFGIKTGTNVGEAKRICPGLKLVLADHAQYVIFHHRIMAAVETVLPIHHVASIDEFACELMGDERQEAVAIQKAHAIKAAIRAQVGVHVRCSIGIAPNRYLAKVATDLQKPDGLVVIRQAELPEPLMKLTPRDLPGIGRQMERRLALAGVHSFADLWELAPKQMRALWGSVAGEQMYYRLRGVDIASPETTRGSVGHSHMLAPELRPVREAHIVAQRLTLKAASRLRRIEHRAGAMDLSVRLGDFSRAAYRLNFPPASDNFQFLRALEIMWAQLMAERHPPIVRKVSVTLHHLYAEADVVPTLFDAPAADPQNPKRLTTLSLAMDRLNARFGRDTVVMGFTPNRARGFSGTKIAFTRVPEQAEFHE